MKERVQWALAAAHELVRACFIMLLPVDVSAASALLLRVMESGMHVLSAGRQAGRRAIKALTFTLDRGGL